MVASRWTRWADLAVRAVRWADPEMPASYAEGAATPAHIPIPEVPRPAPLASELAAELDAGAADVLSSQAITPAPPSPASGLLDLAGLALTTENVEAVLDDMVRPALNADGGDITLVKIEHGNVYVRLVGACSSCPSSIMTLRMGVERLLQDEFPDMGDLIQVDDPAYADWG